MKYHVSGLEYRCSCIALIAPAIKVALSLEILSLNGLDIIFFVLWFRHLLEIFLISFCSSQSPVSACNCSTQMQQPPHCARGAQPWKADAFPIRGMRRECSGDTGASGGFPHEVWARSMATALAAFPTGHCGCFPCPGVFSVPRAFPSTGELILDLLSLSYFSCWPCVH